MWNSRLRPYGECERTLASLITFGSEQYMWKSEGPNGHPDPNLPPVTKTLATGTRSITLPKAAVTVLRGKLGA